MTKPARILAIAGSDSGGGAGLQADIKTITNLGGHAMTAVTVITAQNTLGVQESETVSINIVLAQIDSVESDIGIDAIKIGMLGSSDLIGPLAQRLAHLEVPIVFDPVMVATSGSMLADEATIAGFHALMRVATITTPNLTELARLTSSQLSSTYEMEREARRLSRDSNCMILAKGGHLESDLITDIFVQPDGKVDRWKAGRIETQNNHGTGCALSSALATGLGQGLAPVDAISQARGFVRAALIAAPELGQGNGPLGFATMREYWP
ncbi:bifunctional hydroxymethylpyrimidine kinase/phosphomethylpyrimidine kinase [Parasphingopyxis sp. CP4]|uniref:bifunctional hydroxymethylpyrimidine kinase/phosphomethylpyrimidine kinase n=1 Tax=Parasphingopyxis sp. CP4 TaxID=2724527 RepID=UPI0015A3930E|nr:bifunctional hydroxymethylpyrimidine kinase/phosphomethylpyrimidine kinase [Parasphingopyxis sp. CP4]QLC21023.1 bifunctional hydroxymethylpyrimidine kinase/phosphomethylpyrimidine kinase [Parasphingopyxis sp. CP4]